MYGKIINNRILFREVKEDETFLELVEINKFQPLEWEARDYTFEIINDKIHISYFKLERYSLQAWKEYCIGQIEDIYFQTEKELLTEGLVKNAYLNRNGYSTNGVQAFADIQELIKVSLINQINETNDHQIIKDIFEDWINNIPKEVPKG